MATPELRALGNALGTEALGVDLSKLDDPTFAWIQKAFAEHPVLVFRNQHLGAGDIAAFGRRFGTPRIHSLVGYRHEAAPAADPASVAAALCPRPGQSTSAPRRHAEHLSRPAMHCPRRAGRTDPCVGRLTPLSARTAYGFG